MGRPAPPKLKSPPSMESLGVCWVTIADFFSIEDEPALWIPSWSERLQYGYLVGLAADLYGTPTDLTATLEEASGGDVDRLHAFIQQFDDQIKSLFEKEDNVLLTRLSFLDDNASFIRLLKRNWSHFAGDNLRFINQA